MWNTLIFFPQARFIKVCHRIGHSEGEWVATVLVSDEIGASLKVHLSNEVIMMTLQDFYTLGISTLNFMIMFCSV